MGVPVCSCFISPAAHWIETIIGNEVQNMVSEFDAIYLSPHLDDVALSCGGQIFQRTQRGERILIVTITAGDILETAVSGYANTLHTRWALPTDPITGRREEDKAACRILGADFMHLDIPDCIYRTNVQTGDPFYVSDDDIFGQIHPVDKAQVTDLLHQQLQHIPPAREWFVPLGIGRHVDHQLTRTVAESVFSAPLFYYEDYPYAQDEYDAARVMSAERLYWHSKIITLSAAALQARIAAIAAFTSQLSTFFKGYNDLVQQVTRFTRAVGGERIWHKSFEK